MNELRITDDSIQFVVCGRFEDSGNHSLKPDRETDKIIRTLIDSLKQKELYPYAEVNFCNCGNAHEHGPSITVLPEKVRYLDIEDDTIREIVERHLEEKVEKGAVE